MAGKKMSSRGGNDPKLAKAVSGLLRKTGRPADTRVTFNYKTKGKK